MRRILSIVAAAALAAACGSTAFAAYNLVEGAPDIQSAGPLAFGPEGILFIGDAKGAAVFAVDTQDAAPGAKSADVDVKGIGQKIADLVGAPVDQIAINDLAVNPHSGATYLSVAVGLGPEAQPLIVKVDGQGAISELSLEKVWFAKAALANPPEDKVVDDGRRQQNNRLESITDLQFAGDKLLVAGLSNEEFASKMHAIAFPFATSGDAGTSIEIYHASHGQLETRSPIRTFTTYAVDGQPQLLAAYTCTPLVKVPMASLAPGEKIRGATIAELGNHNRPLDMFVYHKDDADYLLMANNARGVMKMPLAGVGDAAELQEHVDDKAGMAYETIDELQGVVQLDRLDDSRAILLVQADGGLNLSTAPLP